MVPRWDSECCVGSQIALLSICLHEDPPKMFSGRSSGESKEMKGKPRQHSTIFHGSEPRLALYSSLITHVPHVWNKWKTICKKGVCVFGKMTKYVHAHLFKPAPTFIQKHVKNHEKIMQHLSQIDSKSIKNR